ncbi:MAG TPA: hypothetical protein VKV02_05725 [Acidobacteriaceae bacterium]|nr:hypothetical protein [Acidobacteriaceae bacterium]
MILLLAGSLPTFAALRPHSFALAGVLGLVAGALVWMGAAWFARLWNRSFSWSWFHYLVCAVAAVYTVFCVVSFASLAEVDQVVTAVVVAWNNETDLMLGFPVTAPTGSEIGRQDAHPGDVAQLSGAEAASSPTSQLLESFEGTHPFLAAMLRRTPIAAELSVDSAPRNSPALSAPTIAAVSRAIANALQDQIAQITLRLRIVLTLSFLLLQAAALGLLAYSADRDLRPSL